MSLTERQYERVARRLDGEDIRLDERERAGMEEIAAAEAAVGAMLAATESRAADSVRRAARLADLAADERALAPLLEADCPPEATDRAWRKTQAALARPQRRLLTLAGASGAIAAAAAAVLVVSLAARQPTAPPRRAASPVAAKGPHVSADAEAYARSVETDHDPAIRLLAAELDQLEAEVIASAPPTPVDAGLDHAEHAVERFWLEEIPIE